MDLAKIRKKSLLPLVESVDRSFISPVTSHELTKETLDNVIAVPVCTETDSFKNEQCFPEPLAPIVTAATFTGCLPPERITSVCNSPLEAILAGRSAAGCDDESILADDIITCETTVDSHLEFLCFRVSDEIYGINIMDIKEIIKPREVTEIPRAPAFVSGVLSLRGTIIPVIDMRLRMGLAVENPTGKERIVVIKNNNSFSGLLVDEVIQVVQVQPNAVEAAPTVLDGIDRDFVSGLGRSDGRLIIILNLENIADINLF